MLLTREKFEAEITPGKIFYFPCPELNTPVPHYFICIIRQSDEIIILSCGTSKFETVKRLIEINRFPNETLVYIPSSDIENPFNLDTYINCNEYFPYSSTELWDMYKTGALKIKGTLPEDSLHQIYIGFHNSPLIEEELKSILPDLNSSM